MAVRQRFVDQWVGEHGPLLLHLCRDEQSRQTILREGLVPADVCGAGNYDGPLTARPGHVYLCTAQAADAIWCQIGSGATVADGSWVAVDVRQLDAAKINPDEDCFYESFIADEPVALGALSDPSATVRDEWCLTGAERAVMDWKSFNARPYGSYGQWAAEQQLGSVAQQTEQAWLQVGSLAYCGSISPDALSAAQLTDAHWRTAAAAR